MAGLAVVFAAVLFGVVVDERSRPVPSVAVKLAGANAKLERRTDASGHFLFSGLDPATYAVDVEGADGIAHASIDLGSGGARVSLTLLRNVARVNTSALPSLRGSGTDVTYNQTLLSRTPSGRTFPSLLLQLPGAARGANGVVHMSGDHGDINYIVDGVPVPQQLNRTIGAEFDLADVSFIDVLQGAYPAEYGNRFAAVVNVNTSVGTQLPGVRGYLRTGSFASSAAQLAYSGTFRNAAYVLSANATRSDRFLDPPDADAFHDAGSSTNAFLRVTGRHGADFWNGTLSRSYQSFQVPNDTTSGQPPATDDNEDQSDIFAALSYHHSLRGGAAAVLSLGAKQSTIRDFPDQQNDFIAGPYSLYASRTARDVILAFNEDAPSKVHDVRFGASVDATAVNKRYEVSLAPGDALSQNAYTVVDGEPNDGGEGSVYAQDAWRIGTRYEVDYGLRLDAFRISSAEFSRAFSQVSPRVKVVRNLTPRANLYVYYGRFFTPFSFENVSPRAAHEVNLTLQPSVAQFDLLPQRDSDYEAGGHLPVGSGQLGLRVMQKNATDLIDDTQVGSSALHQDINYAQGRISSQSAYYQHPLPRAGRVYASLTRTRSVNKGCETQLLAPCFGAPDDWTPADHDQRWDANAGAVVIDRRGGWLSITGEYGSGLSSAEGCASSILFCKVSPHLTFDVEKGVALQRGVALTIDALNIFNDRYLVTRANAQGTHYASPRVIQFGLQFGP